MAVTKEGTRVKILTESARWYQVRGEDGVEAWIYKPLVRIEQEPMQSSSGTPVALAQSNIPKAAFAVAATSDVFVELQAANTVEEPSWDTPLAVPIDAPPVLPQMIWTAWVVDPWLSHLLSPAAYAIMALLMVLALSITLQLRSAKQLRRAMREMEHILDVVEEIYAGGLLARTSASSTALHLAPAEARAQEPAPPQIGFSLTEYAVLEALSDQQEVQEAELGKILAEKGFAGMLIKAVIGNIVRKTGMGGCHGWRCAMCRASIVIGSGLKRCRTSRSTVERGHESEKHQATNRAHFALLKAECEDGYGTTHLRTSRSGSEERPRAVPWPGPHCRRP